MGGACVVAVVAVVVKQHGCGCESGNVNGVGGFMAW